MINKYYNDLPEINQRLFDLIQTECNGNVSRFSSELGLTNSQKINRLFKIDKRSNQYPKPSSDVLSLIKQRYNISVDYLLHGNDNVKTINNINIDANKINGNSNVIGNENNVSNEMSNNEYIDIIKKQQEQIDKLILLLSTK